MRITKILRTASAAAITTIAGGCATTPFRAFLVTRAGVESELAAAACPEVTKRLGPEAARELLQGHIVRRGQSLVFVVREWNASNALPLRRLTLETDPELQSIVSIPHEDVTFRVDRTSADGRVVKPLTIKSGTLKIMRVVHEFDISIELRFTDINEPSLKVSGMLPILDLYSLDPSGGRAVPAAAPDKYIKWW
ncbi:MAG: hypothetical protein ACKVS6_08360 [Planctomycetota bacterium]